MFSCHIDTCHSFAESDGSKQRLAYDASFGHIMLLDKAASGCLGGDDGVGIYVMLKMMKAKIKGSYVFHVGEEKGGIGSNAILKTQEPWLKEFDRCIAFDRAVKHGEGPEVICTQGGKACASVAFGEQLKAALNANQFEDPWVVGHGGTFTDSKVYSDIIPECVNLGAFYLYQHTRNEVVDSGGVEKLLAACLKIKWESLKVVRVPEAPKPYTAPKYGKGYYKGQQGASQHGYPRGAPEFDARQYGFGGMADDDFYDVENAAMRQAAAKPILPASPFKTSIPVPTQRSTFASIMDYTKEEIIELIDSDPEVAGDVLCLLIARYKGLKAENEALSEFLGA